MQETRDEIRREPESERERNKWMLAAIISGIVLCIIILFFILSRDSHYEEGVQYLREKQYTAALVEFQKVEHDDKDFRMAQSKINYINGLLAFNQGLNQQAKIHLVKVDPADEYYHEAQLMLDKLNLTYKQRDLESLSDKVNNIKDTVVKEKIIEKTTDKVDEAGTKSNVAETNDIYLSGLKSLVNEYESLYLSAKDASVESKKLYVKNMDSLYNEFIKMDNNLKDRNAVVVELRQLANSWMQKRIAYINQLIAENSMSETKNSRTLKEEGDKEYSVLLVKIRKY